MTRHRVAAATVAAGLALLAGAVPALAQTPDEEFTQAVKELGIPLAAGTDAPTVGKRVCENLTVALQANAVNPVPAVRGVITNLAAMGMTREQAGGLLKASVYVYCPQHARFVGR
jgi:hypothetical protein